MDIKLQDIRKVAVIGAGTMGQGIAQIIAMAGYSVLLQDVNREALTRAETQINANLTKGESLGKVFAEQKALALRQIQYETDSRHVVADLIIEAIIENLDVKVKLFQDLEANNSPNTILATNTSSIPITQIGAGLQHPERLIGLHFFNPAHIMKLVEIISGAVTAPQLVTVMKEFALKLEKLPVVAKDSPGFIVNRVARHYYVESLKLLEENVADIETIDQLMEASGFKMGPFRLMDLIGVDTNFSVTTSIFHAFHHDAKFRPSRIQQQKVDAGHHGKKSKKGFYDY